MEEEQNEDHQESQQEEPVEELKEKEVKTKVAFPSRRRRKFKVNKKTIAIFAVVVIGGLVGWFIFRGKESEEVLEPTPPPFEEITSTPTPTSAPVDKDRIKIEVLNGTGIPEEASFLQGKLRDLGYTEIEVGNADSQDFVATKVTFSKGLQDEVIDEITSELENIYKDVDTETSDSLDVDIRIITGYKKGHTPTPSPTATPSPTPTEEVTPTSTPSATPTP